MGFSEAVSTCFAKYATFQGRAMRPEYWWFVLFTFLVHLGLSVIAMVALGMLAMVLKLLFSLAVLLPSIAVGARRLHDIDRTGWWLLIGLVPVIGWIVLIVWFCTPGTRGANRFG